MPFARVLVAYLGGSVVAGVVGTFLATQFNLATLQGLGVAIPAAGRWATVYHDVFHMGPTFIPLVAAAFLIALLVAAGITRVLRGLRLPGYVLAGAAAMVAMLVIMEAQFDGIKPVYGAATTAGLVAQAVAGALGGFAFYLLCPKPGENTP